MPLIRCLTGDLGRLLGGECVCGNPLRRLDKVLARMSNRLETANGVRLSMGELDETLFSLEGVLDFRAGLEGNAQGELLWLHLAVFVGMENSLCTLTRRCLRAHLEDKGGDEIAVAVTVEPWERIGVFPGKRILEERRPS